MLARKDNVFLVRELNVPLIGAVRKREA